MKNIEDFKVFKGINKYENIMQLIYQLLKNLFQAIGEEDNNKRIIIIDNINNLEETDEAFITLDKIKKLILDKNYNYKLIILW